MNAFLWVVGGLWVWIGFWLAMIAVYDWFRGDLRDPLWVEILFAAMWPVVVVFCWLFLATCWVFRQAPWRR